jgi:hypothetical protein
MLPEKAHEYFREIEMASALQERAVQLCNEFATFIPAKIERVFVTDLYDPQGVRRYLNLELVAGGILMECKNFIVSDNIDFLDLRGGIKWIEITKNELKDIDGQTTKSWLRASIVFAGFLPGFAPGVMGTGQAGLTLNSAHNNCRHLV